MNLNDTLIHLLAVNGRGAQSRWSSHAQDRLPSIRRLKETISRGGAEAARLAHNQKVAGSSPVPAIFASGRKEVLAGLRSAAADEIYELSEPAR
jgi:hypothetical protein